jgi:hypothetical protein
MKYIYIEFHLPFFLFGSSNLFLPASSKIWHAFGHWQPAISSPGGGSLEVLIHAAIWGHARHAEFLLE